MTARLMSRWIDRLRNLAAGSLSTPSSGATAAPAAADELVETLRKTARAVAKLGARFDGLDANVSELVAHARRRDDELFSPLMDSLDALDAARAATASGQYGGVEAGLAGIQQRLEGFLTRVGYTRHAGVGIPVDGRIQRVVGTQASSGGRGHSVARVVRAAITRGEVVVRSGEVIAIQSSEGSRE